MKKHLTPLIFALAVNAACAQTIAFDARTEHRLSSAHKSAKEATETYRRQPNGTTRALADLAYCKLLDQRDAARARSFVVDAVDEEIEALQKKRSTMMLPAAPCSPSRSPLTTCCHRRQPLFVSSIPSASSRLSGLKLRGLVVADLKTNYPYPWVLVFSGGQIPGQARRTALAWIHDAIVDQETGVIGMFTIRFVRGGLPNKQKTRIAASLIAFEFTRRRFEMPSLERVKQAKRTIRRSSTNS